MSVDYWYCRKTRVNKNLQNNRNHLKSNENMCKNFEKKLNQMNQCIPSKVKKEQVECEKVLIVSIVVTKSHNFVEICTRIFTKVY